MSEYKREYPLFSLCGLNCGLCPRYQSEGSSRCPGCGGEDFASKHPSCKVINCAKKHGTFEYCFECTDYPCAKYCEPSVVDSFISYANVQKDMEQAKIYGIEHYKSELNEKLKILEFLLHNYNDGRRKNYYCTAVNLLDLPVLLQIQSQIKDMITAEELPLNVMIDSIRQLFEEQAANLHIKLKLRK